MNYKELPQHTKARQRISLLVFLAFAGFAFLMAMRIDQVWVLLTLFAYVVLVGILHIGYRKKHKLAEVNKKLDEWVKYERYGMVIGLLGFSFFLFPNMSTWAGFFLFLGGAGLELFAESHNRVWIDAAKVPQEGKKRRERKIEKL